MSHLTAKSLEEGAERRVAAAQSACSQRHSVTCRWDGSLWKMRSVKQKAVKINLTKVSTIFNTCLMKALSQNPFFFRPSVSFSSILYHLLPLNHSTTAQEVKVKSSHLGLPLLLLFSWALLLSQLPCCCHPLRHQSYHTLPQPPQEFSPLLVFPSRGNSSQWHPSSQSPCSPSSFWPHFE